MADLIDRQAAIKAIENLQDCYNGFSDTYDKACIIGVLMEIPTAQVNTQTDTPTDMISRQAALALAKDICVHIKDGTVYRHRCIDPQQIMDLPSAQPEIIMCKDCKNSEHWYGDKRRCFLWSEDGVSVFNDGFCNYAERRTK